MKQPPKKIEDTPKAPTKKRVVRLDDLDWEDEVVGGRSGKLCFGEQPESGVASDDLFQTDKKHRRK